jgi:hypothetical protein
MTASVNGGLEAIEAPPPEALGPRPLTTRTHRLPYVRTAPARG